MSFINPQTKTVHCKIVYFGPAMSGKSTTLRSLYRQLGGKKDGIETLSRDQDRTLFFDFLPLSLGEFQGHRIRIHLYSVPGPILYDANRRLVLKGIDGIVFVADSQLNRLEENMVCLNDIQENLLEQEVLFDDVPLVFQYNKRDLTKTAVPVAVLEQALNRRRYPAFETIATKGEGLFDPLKVLAKQVLLELNDEE